MTRYSSQSAFFAHVPGPSRTITQSREAETRASEPVASASCTVSGCGSLISLVPPQPPRTTRVATAIRILLNLEVEQIMSISLHVS